VYELPQDIKRVCVYIRRSREDIEAEARGEDTLSRQRELMQKDVLPRYGIFDYDLYEEVVSGDSIEARPEFKKVIDALRRGEYQAIATKDLSRLGRGKYSDMGVVYDLIQDHNIHIITTTGVLDPRNQMDLRMLRFSLFFNREEYEQTVWRLTQGKYDAAKAGKYIAGCVPFGFEYNARTQVLEPKEGDADLVRTIFSWFAHEELGYRAICTRLKKQGILSPRGKNTWQAVVIHRMLRNPSYNGTLAFRLTQRSKTDGRQIKRPESEHIVVPNAWEPLIDEVTWQKTQKRISKKVNTPPVKMDFSPCELAGLVHHECGKKMVRQSSTQYYTKENGEVSNYYKEFLYCVDCGQSVKYRDCESRILESIRDTLELDDEYLQTWVSDMLRSSHIEQQRLDYISTIKRMTEKKDSATRKLKRARDFLLDGTFSKQEYESARRDCNTELETIDRQIYEIEKILQAQQGQTIHIDLESIRVIIGNMLSMYKLLDDTKTKKNALLRELFEHVYISNIVRGVGRKSANFKIRISIKPGILV